jgi:hypothetical protein
MSFLGCENVAHNNSFRMMNGFAERAGIGIGMAGAAINIFHEKVPFSRSTDWTTPKGHS